MLANYSKKPKSFNQDLFEKLKHFLRYSLHSKEEVKFNTSSVAITSNSEYFSGMVAHSKTHLLDITSELAVLSLAVSNKDPNVKKVITLIDGNFVLSPIVIKLLVDHFRRTGTNISYEVYNMDAELIYECNNVNNLFYNDEQCILEKIKDWVPRENKVNVDKTRPLEEQLRVCAIKGAETHFSSNTKSLYGAAVLVDDTIYFGGVYSSFDHRLGLHAEMVAALCAFADGKKNISHVGLISTKFFNKPTHMCGCCRQFFSELQSKTGVPIKVSAFSYNSLIKENMLLSDYLPSSWDAYNGGYDDDRIR